MRKILIAAVLLTAAVSLAKCNPELSPNDQCTSRKTDGVKTCASSRDEVGVKNDYSSRPGSNTLPVPPLEVINGKPGKPGRPGGSGAGGAPGIPGTPGKPGAKGAKGLLIFLLFPVTICQINAL